MKKKLGLQLFLGLGVGLVGYVLLSRLGYLMPLSQLPEVMCWKNCGATAFHTFSERLPRGEGQALTQLLGDDVDPQTVSLYVQKSDARLTVFHLGKPVKSYDMVLGSNPIGDKQREGDLKTPEGVFQVRDLYPHDSWSKFIWLNYPTGESWRKHFAAKLSGKIGLFSTIGSEVGIHGVPDGADRWIQEQKNWTWGCVSLTNPDVDEIYRVIGQNTVVEIVP